MSRLLKVADRKDLVKDKKSGAILHCDETVYKKHKKQRDEEISKEERLNKIEKTLDELVKLLKRIDGSNNSK